MLAAAALLLARPATAAVSLLVAGGTTLVVIDGNGDGPGPGDCVIAAIVDPGTIAFGGFGTFTIMPTQDTTVPLRACAGTSAGSYSIGSDSSSDYITADISSTNIPASGSMLPNLWNLPLGLDIYQEFNGAPDATLPIAPNTVEVEDSGFLSLRATLQICSAGGRPAMVGSFLGFPIFPALELYPDAENPTHLVFPNRSFERSDMPGTFVTVNAYVPIADKHFTVSTAGDPTELLIDIDFAALQPCGSLVGAPALSQLGIVALLAAALLGTAWRFRRRRA